MKTNEPKAKYVNPCCGMTLAHASNCKGIKPSTAPERNVVTHTPTPWSVGSDSSMYGDEGRFFVAKAQKQADAEFIVRAVNAYDALSTSHEELLRMVKSYKASLPYENVDVIEELEKLIAKAQSIQGMRGGK